MSEDCTGGAELGADCDDVSAALTALAGAPVEEHVLTYQALHEKLAGALAGTADSGPSGGPPGADQGQR